jgi:hypothetical protein
MMTISPGFPQLRRLFGSFQRPDSVTIDERATPPTIEAGRSIMNQHVNRRKVFASSVALAAAAIPFDNGNASPLPQSEAPVTKVNRLARELSLAMDDWMKDLGEGPDACVAHIYPSKSRWHSGFQSFHGLGGSVVPEWEYTPLPHHADSLSFMRRRKPAGSGIEYWTVEASGSYSLDCNCGRQLAHEYLKFIGNHPTNGNATLLGCIVNDMLIKRAEAKKLSGLEIGFLMEVNKYTMATAKVLVDTMGTPEA